MSLRTVVFKLAACRITPKCSRKGEQRSYNKQPYVPKKQPYISNKQPYISNKPQPYVSNKQL